MTKRRFSLRRMLSQTLRLPLAGPLFRLYSPRRRISANANGTPVRRVLLVNLMPSLGDTVCYMAMVDVLVEALPGVEITWVADSAMAGFIRQHPGVHRVIAIATPHPLLRRVPTVKMYYRLYRVVRTLLHEELEGEFEVAVIPRGGVDPALSAHAVWVLHLPRSVGYSHRVEPEDVDHNFGDGLLTDVVNEVTVLHEASRGLALLAKVGLVPDALERWQATMPITGIQAMAGRQDKAALPAKLGIAPEQRFVALAPGAGAHRKEWPENKFAALCRLILKETGCAIVLTGTAAEWNLNERIAATLDGKVVNTAGGLTLQELIGVLSHATAFVGNDSGTGHLAGALGIPVISLHVQAKGSDPRHIHAPEHYRPTGPHVTVVQPDAFLAPCQGRCESSQSHCIAQIEVTTVWNALWPILQES